MNELRSGTETSDTAQHSEASPAAGHDGHRAAQAAEDRLPLRQDSRTAWDDDPGYDESDLDADYDGDLEALLADDRLPPRQASGTASWDDDPWYDDPWYDEADLAAGYDGDLDAVTDNGHATVTSEEHAPDGGDGDQDQAAPDNIPQATGKPGDPPAETPATSAENALAQENDNVPGSEPSSDGVSADTGSVADAGAGEQPDEASQAEQADAVTGQAGQPADSHADPETELKELKAEYEASLKDLKYELQALKDLWQPVSEAPGDTGREADQPRYSDRKLPVEQRNPEEPEHQDDRPGIWSNAKYALYGAVGTTVGMALLDQFAPGVSRVVDDIIVGVPTVIGALVPTLREGWKRKHDNPPDKR